MALSTGTSSSSTVTIATGSTTPPGSAINLISIYANSAATITISVTKSGGSAYKLAKKTMAADDSFILQTEKLILESGDTVSLTTNASVDYIVSYLNGI